MPVSKLTLRYFPVPGRAFAIRVALAKAGIEYTDERIGFPKLQELRGATGSSDAVPLGQLPVLEFPDGRVVCQSGAIARWAGRQAGLYPSDVNAALFVDEIYETCQEISSRAPRDADPEKFKALREAWAKSGLATCFNLLEKRAAASSGPFITGADLTIADLAVYQTVHSIKSGQYDHIDKGFTDSYPKTVAIHDAVKGHPAVVAHMATYQ